MRVITHSLLQTCMRMGLNIYAENRLATLDQLQLDRKKNNVACFKVKLFQSSHSANPMNDPRYSSIDHLNKFHRLTHLEPTTTSSSLGATYNNDTILSRGIPRALCWPQHIRQFREAKPMQKCFSLEPFRPWGSHSLPPQGWKLYLASAILSHLSLPRRSRPSTMCCMLSLIISPKTSTLAPKVKYYGDSLVVSSEPNMPIFWIQPFVDVSLVVS